MRVDYIEIRILDKAVDGKDIRYALKYSSGTWAIDGVVYPRYLKLMADISEFVKQENRITEKEK